MKAFFIFIMLAVCSTLGACASGHGFSGKFSEAPSKHIVVAQMVNIKPLNKVVACMRPALSGKRVAIAAWADGTGKGNAVADAGTGNDLPGATSGDFTIDTLKQAGMKVQDLASVDGESNLRILVTDKAKENLKKKTTSHMPNYYLNGAWTSLDFDRNHSLDIEVAGIGPYLGMQRATMSASVKLVEPGTMEIAGHGALKMSAYSRQGGVNSAKLFGFGGGTLITGQAGLGTQDPLQLMSGDYAAKLATAKAMAQLPHVPQKCGNELDKLVGPDNVSL